jgi:hypothetical protein
MASEPIPKILRDRTPDLPTIIAAIEEFKANKPVTQRSSKTGELLVVQEDEELGVLIVICDGHVVYRSRRRPTLPNATPISQVSMHEGDCHSQE